MSARQAGQVAASGTTLVVTAPLRLATIRKSAGGLPAQWGRFDRVDPGEGRDLGRERDFELDERRGISKDADQHAVAIVPHRAGQPEALCDPPDRGPEPYALHEAADPDGYSLDTVYCVQPPPSQCNV